MRNIVPFAAVLLLRLTGAAGAFLVAIVAAKTLGPEAVGAFLIGTSFATVSSRLCRCGLDTSIVRTVGAAASRESQAEATTAMAVRTTGLSLAFTIGCLLLGFLLHTFGYNSLNDYLLSSIAIPFISFASSIGFAVQGLNRGIQATVLTFSLQPILTVVGLLIANLLTGSLLSLWQGILIFLISCMITAASAAFIWLHLGLNRRPSEEIAKEVFGPTQSLLPAAILTQTVLWFSQLVSPLFLSPVDLSLFTVSQRLTSLFSILQSVINLQFSPRFAKAFKTDQPIDPLVVKTSRVVLAAATIPALVMLCYPRQVLTLLGEEYASAATLLRILCVGQLCNLLSGPVAVLLNMSKNDRFHLRSVAIAALITVASSPLLLHWFGLIGGGIAVTLGIATQNLVAAHYVRRVLRIKSFRLV